jgi:hypothetical protein
VELTARRRRGQADALRRAPGPDRQSVVSLELTLKQREFLEAVLSGRYRYLALGGAIRGTKTFSVLIAFTLLMRFFPRSRWAIVREDWTALQQNTVPSIEKLRETLGGWLGPLNHATRIYRAQNGSELLLVPESITQDPDLNSFKGFEVNGFGLEEANELALKTFHKAIERAGAWVIPATAQQKADGVTPEQPPPLVLCTFNPSDEWTDSVFHEPYELGTIAPPYYFLPTTIRDNPHLPQSYLDSLEELRTAAPDEYARFVEGKRGAVTQPNQLIPAEWLAKARAVPHAVGPIREAVDVARFGDDETVFGRQDGNWLVELEAHAKWSTTQTADRAAIRIAEHRINADRYVVDTVGLGAGVADQLHATGLRVREFIAGGRPVHRIPSAGKPSLWKFYDLRSQAWWEFREKIRTGLWGVSPALVGTPAYAKLVKDLTAPRYKISGDKTIRVESKDEIKQRIGRSTDYGDAAVMAAFDLPPAANAPPMNPNPRRYAVAGY